MPIRSKIVNFSLFVFLGIGIADAVNADVNNNSFSDFYMDQLSGDSAQTEINLTTGISKVISAPRVTRVAVGNGDIVTATVVEGREILLFANAAGATNLQVWYSDGRRKELKVQVGSADALRTAKELASYLRRIPNAKTSVIGGKVVVEGDNLSDDDLFKISTLEKNYKPMVINLADGIGLDKMIFMDVKIVEFPKNKLREIGVKWTVAGGAAIGGVWSPIKKDQGAFEINIPGTPPIVSSNPSSSNVAMGTALALRSGLNAGINAQINLLEQKGEAVILSEPQLSARNGAEASFLAGGEYPFTVSSPSGTTVQFKPYGIKLKVTPRVSRGGIIRAKIESEVSSIDASLVTEAGPGLRTRNTQTEFNVLNGETIVLSGLLSRSKSVNLDKFPLLGSIPVLGALFRSKQYQDDQTELVVFMTPTVVDDKNAAGLVDRTTQVKTRLEQQLGQNPYIQNPLQARRDPEKVFAPIKEQSLPIVLPAAIPARSLSLEKKTQISFSNNEVSDTKIAFSNGISPVIIQGQLGSAPIEVTQKLAEPMQNLQSIVSTPIAVPVNDSLSTYISSESVQYQSTADALALRSAPARTASLIGYLQQGRILELDTKRPHVMGWIPVRVLGGRYNRMQGWVSADFVIQTNKQNNVIQSQQ